MMSSMSRNVILSSCASFLPTVVLPVPIKPARTILILVFTVIFIHVSVVAGQVCFAVE